jgi:ketosteroid isomerase-like protein/effector-binding domain-containing protein
MWIRAMSVVLIIILTGGTMTLADQPGKNNEERALIEEIIHDTIGWALTKDRERLESILAHDDDFFIFHPNWDGTIVGWDAFVELFDFWMDPRFKATHMDVRDMRIQFSESGDVAWFSAILDDLGEWDGKPTEWKDTRWTGILERREGKWLVVQMHFSFASDKVLAGAKEADKEKSSEPGEERPVKYGAEPGEPHRKPTHPNIRFVSTGPLRAVVFQAVGSQPEPEAFGQLADWAGPLGLLEEPSTFLLLGRNNPPPSPEGGEYGYEYMLTIPDDVDVPEGIKTAEVPPAEYAVTRANLHNMTAKWEWLYRWAEEHAYTVTGHGFEEHLTIPGGSPESELWFDLWLPVVHTPR